SLTSLSVHPTPLVQLMPLSTSDTRSRLINVMSTHEYECCGLLLKDMHALYDHKDNAHPPIPNPTLRESPRFRSEPDRRQRKLIAASVKKVPAPPSAPAVMQRPINSGVDVVLKYW
ncbi:MAG: hypothetical protein TREMPRED_005377, partial [Tremellales sp. Tagirdzhanova-0007]